MIKYTIICAQSLKQKFIEEAESLYKERLTGQVAIKIIELKVKTTDAMAPEQIKNLEAEKILSQVPHGSLLIALDENGELVSSEKLAQKIKQKTVQGTSHFCFVIGGAYGLSSEILKKSAMKLSLSPLTFTYQLARLVLIEQLYRITMIMAGKPYHKA